MFATSVNSPDYIKGSGATYLVVKDHLGSVRLVVNSSDGTVTERLDYSDLGKVLSDTNPGFQTYGFAGGIYDHNTGLVKFGAREYDGATGRWLSKDPILFSGGVANLFSYSANDPINRVDLSGLRSPGQGSACLDGICSGTTADQFSSQTQISVDQAKYNDAVVGSTGIALAAVVASPAIGEAGAVAAVTVANACLAHPIECATMMSEFTAGIVGGVMESYTPGSNTPSTTMTNYLGSAIGQDLGDSQHCP